MAAQTTGKILRTFNAAGPCIPEGRIVRETEKFYIVQSRYPGDGQRRFSKARSGRSSAPHIEPCKCCTDHPETYYPNGYDN